MASRTCGTRVTGEINYGSNSMDVVLEEDYMTWLGGLAVKYRMDKWDGFDKVDKRVLDGESFDLHIALADGEEILASGSNAFPKNFDEPMMQVETLIDGEYAFNGTCAGFPFEEVQKCVRKHDIPAWNGWDMAGEEEAFVVRCMYSSGECVEAYGTAHPEGYDAFRDDITALLMEYITEEMGI